MALFRYLSLLLLFYGGVFPSFCIGQKIDNTSLSDEIQLEAKIEDIKTQLTYSKQSETRETAQKLNVPLHDLRERTETLSSLISIYNQLLVLKQRSAALDKEKILIEEQTRNQFDAGLQERPPFDLSVYDRLVNELEAVSQEQETIEQTIHLTNNSLVDAREKIAEQAKKVRLINEKIENTKNGNLDTTLTFKRDLNLLKNELASAIAQYETQNLDLQKKQSALLLLQREQIEKQVNWVQKNLTVVRDDLDTQRKLIEDHKQELYDLRVTLIAKKSDVEKQWNNVHKEFLAVSDSSTKAVVEAQLKEYEAWLNAYQEVLDHIEKSIPILEQQEIIWNRRYSLLEINQDQETLSRWKEEADSFDRNLAMKLELTQDSMMNLQSKIARLDSQIESSNDKDVRELIQQRLKALHWLIEQKYSYISLLMGSSQLNRRLLNEINSRFDGFSPSQTIESLKQKILKLWDYEIMTIDDRSVTSRKIVIAVFLLIIGILIVRFVVSIIIKRFLEQTQIKKGTSQSIIKLTSYFLYFMIILFALRIVNIPLTAFAFFGGAIAIGIGFGAQNLINNFISGFIIMAESPIHVGDLIDVDGLVGTVEEIGARSTRVRTGENIRILVPNSSFLEKNITNWTHSDNKIRTTIIVGVAYGSPVRRVEELLLKAAEDEPKVLKVPKPFVLFKDFGDNALIFTLNFWIIVRRPIEKDLIASSIRFAIDDSFNLEKIVIAFPQRDIHFDTHDPLDIRIIGDK